MRGILIVGFVIVVAVAVLLGYRALRRRSTSVEESDEETAHVSTIDPNQDQEELIAGYRSLAGTLDAILSELETDIRPGVTTRELEARATELMEKHGVRSYFKGYRGYPASITTSVNHEVINTMPSKKVLRSGNILSMQVGITNEKAFSYQGWTYAVGQVTEGEQNLMNASRRALQKACSLCTGGHTVSDISRAIQTSVECAGFFVNRQFVGHGMGSRPHELPQIPMYVTQDPEAANPLRVGQILSIVVIAHLGGHESCAMSDNWNIVTKDGSKAVHFSQIVVVGDADPEILTQERR
jgi:methionyl aminopeptidase